MDPNVFASWGVFAPFAIGAVYVVMRLLKQIDEYNAWKDRQIEANTKLLIDLTVTLSGLTRIIERVDARLSDDH